MKNKLVYLTKSNLKKKLKSKWFIGVNIILIICIPLLCNIDNVIKYFGGDFLDPTKIYVVDNTKNIYNDFEANFDKTNKIVLEQSEINLINSNKTTSELSKKMKKDKSKNIIVEINKDNKNIISSKIISYDTVDSFLYQNIVNSLNNVKSEIALENSNIDLNELTSVNKEIDIDRSYLSKDVTENSELLDTISGYLIPIFIVPFFFLIILVVQMIGAEINDEKTSRSMEIIISSVSPKIHFMSKMISVNLFVVIQGALLIFYALVGIISRTLTTSTDFVSSFGINTNEMITTFINSSLFHDILIAIPFTIILFILSFISYSLIAGILASVTTSIEDYSQIQTPLMIVLMLGYYLAMIASMYDSSVLIKITAFIPLISAIVAPVLLILGQMSIIEIIISMLLVVIFNWLLIRYGLRIYKVGILNYSSNHLWKKMFKAMKTKE